MLSDKVGIYGPPDPASHPPSGRGQQTLSRAPCVDGWPEAGSGRRCLRQPEFRYYNQQFLLDRRDAGNAGCDGRDDAVAQWRENPGGAEYLCTLYRVVLCIIGAKGT